jgi:hypothetical protein
VITGYTWEEVLAVPLFSSQEIMEYFDLSCFALSAQIYKMTEETSLEPVQEFINGKLNQYQWVKFFYQGLQSHVGEIMAIKAMLARNGLEEIASQAS